MNTRFTLEQLPETASQLWNEGKAHKVWAFHASMGTGKTTLIHTLCELLGVRSAVSSPTFAIINEYNSGEAGTIYHMDWYRLKDENEAMNAGVDDSLRSGNFCFVEWPENAAGLLPGNTFHIYMELQEDGERLLWTSMAE